MNLGELRSLLRTYLATSEDDPLYTAASLNAALQDAYDAVVSDVVRANRAYFTLTRTLQADSATSHNYTFPAQPGWVSVDFAAWLEVRYTDADGLPLDEVRYEELKHVGPDYFALAGPDQSVVLTTSPATPAGTPLFLRYVAWPVPFGDDVSVPLALPTRFHSVLALEALFAFGLGGEAARPPELRERWLERKAQLVAHVTRRGVAPSRTRIVQHDD